MSKILAAAIAVALLAGGHALASEKKDCSKEQEQTPAQSGSSPVGYGGAQVQLSPIMAPYRTDEGVLFQPLIVRLVLDAGPNERPACFSVPYVHDRILTYLFGAHLRADDFEGEKRDVLAKALFKIAVDLVGPGYYSALEIIGPNAAPLDCKSETLSSQCR